MGSGSMILRVTVGLLEGLTTVGVTLTTTCTPKVCRIMAFWAIFKGFGPLFYLLWGLGRY